eukprot:TRINITY_DN3419_c0_g1_i5.p1 TRINITY_DN3419_c0_g1~~TRINITY_DN3419_c0_g1_i5.p1  ORF type:complete len:173 (-),score=63.48 TRINITY_DN3419_c0_g1_i5:227-745(-)
MDIVGALRYLETNGICHNDISARNVLIVKEGWTGKLSDFGLARQVKDVGKMQGEKSPVRWSAPEVLKSQKYSHKSDVWMFGVLLWEMWSDGKTPYGDMTNEEVIKFVCEGGKLFAKEEGETVKYLEIIQLCNREEKSRISFEEISPKLSLMQNKIAEGKSDEKEYGGHYIGI